MRVQFMINIGGDYYDFDCFWGLPYFLSIGDSVELELISEPECWDTAKETMFEGKERYKGLTQSLADIVMDCYDIKVERIHWMRQSVQVFLKSDQYDLKYWEVKRE